MIERIKKIIRDGIWETNSSSSHSITIYSGDYVSREDPEFDLNIINNILYIPKRDGDFGWEWEKSNYCQEKLQYVCALMCHSYDTGSGHKEIQKLKNILKSYLGVDDVVFEWDTEYLEKVRQGNDPEDCYRPVPEIDHQSRGDSYDEICESRKTIIDFIFSRKSWWYGGNDNSSDPDDFYKETMITKDTPRAMASIECGGKLGRLDIEIFDFPGNLLGEITEDEVVKSLVYNIETRNLELDNKSGMFSSGWIGFSKRSSEKVEKITTFYLQAGTTIMKNGQPHLLFTGSAEWEDAVHNEYVRQREMYGKSKKRKHYPDYSIINKDLISSGKLVEGKDYVLIPVYINSTEFGKLW